MVDGLNLGVMKALFKKEYMDNIRNRWLVIISIIFLLLAVVISYFSSSSHRGAGFQNLDDTVVGLVSLVSLLVPIISIMLGHGSIIGERERGSMGILLSCPVNRAEIFLGKYAALSGVLLTTIFIGFGGAGVIISVGSGASFNLSNYLMFLLSTFIVGLIFLGLSMLISVFARRRSVAVGGGVLIWFFFCMIISVLITGVYAATSGGSIQSIFGGEIGPSAWLWKVMFLSPIDTYQMNIVLAYGIKNVLGVSVPILPGYVNFWTTLTGIVSWAAVPFTAGVVLFSRKDL